MNVSPDLLERVRVALDAGEVLSLCERGELYGVQCVRIGVALAITPDGSVQVRWETDSQRPMRGHYIGPTLTDHPEVLTPEQVAWELRVLPPTPWPPAPEPGWNLGFPYNRYREGSAQDMAVNVLLRRELAESILLGRPLGDWATHRASLDRAARERRARRGIAEDRAATAIPRLPFAPPQHVATYQHLRGAAMTRFPHTLLALATALPLVVALFAAPLLTGQEPDIYQQALTLLTSVLLGGWVMRTFRKEAQ